MILWAALERRFVSEVCYHSAHDTAAHVRKCRFESWFGAAKMLTKAIQACLTNLHLHSRNVRVWEMLRAFWDSVDPKWHLAEFIFTVGTVGIEGWDTVNLAKWDPPHPSTPRALLSGAMDREEDKVSTALAFHFSKLPRRYQNNECQSVLVKICFSLARVVGEGEGSPGGLSLFFFNITKLKRFVKGNVPQGLLMVLIRCLLQTAFLSTWG